MFEKFNALLSKFRSDQSGVTAVEYGVIAAAVVIAIAVIVGVMGGDIANTFQDVSDALNPPAP